MTPPIDAPEAYDGPPIYILTYTVLIYVCVQRHLTSVLSFLACFSEAQQLTLQRFVRPIVNELLIKCACDDRCVVRTRCGPDSPAHAFRSASLHSAPLLFRLLRCVRSLDRVAHSIPVA